MNELERQAVLSKSEKGKIRLDYHEHGKKKTALWEPVFDGVIETVFDGDGVILRQIFFKGKKESAEDKAEKFTEGSNISDVEEGEFSEIKLLGKKCHVCSADSFVRLSGSAEDSTKAPIMPIYTCIGCNTKCYYLSDEYLESLVANNRAMFDEKEIKELDADKGKFMAELKEYIIRIFASKKIMRIR